MLVLSRKLGEVIVIGDGAAAIRITVIDIDRGKIRLGIEAPRDVPVYRKELLPFMKGPKVEEPKEDDGLDEGLDDGLDDGLDLKW